jgi:hypothetical protein
MKKFTLILAFMMAVSAAFSQYYYLPFLNAGTNPGGINTDAEYPNGGGLDPSWTMILGGPQTSPTWSSSQTIPFTFQFNGATVSSFQVSSSGVLTFAANPGTAPSHTPAALPSASIPDSSVCIWGLQSIGSNDNIMMKVHGTAPNRQLWVFFASYGYNGASGTAWTYWSIVLEETTNNIYMVDQRNGNGTPALSVGIQINNSTAVSVTGSPNVTSQAQTDATASDNSYYQFVYGSQPAYDLAMQRLDIAGYAQPNNSVDIKGTVDNLGSNAVTAFDLSYSVNNGTPVTATISNVNIASLADYDFTHPNAWTPSATGVYDIKVWTSNLNGNPDDNTSNDTLTTTVQIVANVVQRLPLYETFTSSTCGPCVAGNTNMDGLFANNPNKWVAVKYQMSWPGNGDPYYTAEGGVRRGYYGVSSVPNQQIDGGYNANSSSVTQADFDAAYNVPSFVGLEAYMIMDTVTKHLTVGVNIDANIDLPQSARLFIALLEKKTYNNTGSNGETEFSWVMKKMLPDAAGKTLGAVSSGTSWTEFADYTFKGSYRLPPNAGSPINHTIEHSVEEFSDMIAAVWIQNYPTKEVYQSCYSTVILGVAENNPQEMIGKYYPNPAINQVNFDFNLAKSENVTLAVMNNVGQVVKSQNLGQVQAGAQKVTVDITDLNSGVYFFRFMIGNTQFTKPVIVD